ncbi:MAG: SDR family NAD(P)-dependent oxidoreductase [Pirellulales bacterium]
MARRRIADCCGILTGASSGIGRALAEQLVGAGAQLLVVSRRGERLDELAKALSGAPGRIVTLAGDVTHAEVRQAAVERAQHAFGELNLLVNNAGSGAMGRFDQASPERLRQIMEVNFFAPAEMIRAALPALARGKGSIVVNVDSVLAHRGVPGCSEYCASKFALRGLSESLRAEFAPLGIDVLCASPARTETEFFEAVVNPHETGWPGLRGMPADKVARKIVTAIRRGRHEVVISVSGKALVWGNRLLPRLFDFALARSK